MPSQSQKDIERVTSVLLSKKSLKLISCRQIQSLWAGYGHICQIKAITSQDDMKSAETKKPQSFILKYISPPSTNLSVSHEDEGHIRKILSYQIEQYFYTHLAPQLPNEIAVAKCLSSIDATTSSSDSPTTAMILTDLREQFPVAGEKRSELSIAQAHAALKWLANFHGFWWSRINQISTASCVLPPLDHFAQYKSTNIDETKGGVWLNGGYTYLQTRRTEYENLKSDEDSEWSKLFCDPITKDGRSISELVADLLSPSPRQQTKDTSSPNSTSTSTNVSGSNSGISTPSSTSQQPRSSPITPYLTLLHGDVKSENLFTTASNSKLSHTEEVKVAFYDFQYTGLGLGTSDLSKLFTCSVPSSLLHPLSPSSPMLPAEETLLRMYLAKLEQRSGKVYEWDLFVRHWETALVDWCRFQASWGFWGNQIWLGSRVRWILSGEKSNDSGWLTWVQEQMGVELIHT